MNDRKIRMGMVGGGKGAFIGAVHRIAARMDGQIDLVCGVFSSDPAKSRESGKELFLDPARIYDNYQEMVLKEMSLSEGDRMDFVSIVTPNNLHFTPAKFALEHGFPVILDKPMTFNVREALELGDIIREKGLLLCLTHTYTGYPMVKEARQVIKDGLLGTIRKVFVEYPQGWLTTHLEGHGVKQADWRTDPSRSGVAGCMGDIGSHAANLVEYITSHKITQVCANINIIVPGRLLDDDGAVLFKMDNGGSGVLFATQVAAGEENCLKIRVYGDKGGLEWKQDDANSLILKWLDRPIQVKRTGGPSVSAIAMHNTRVPAGHPEGYLEAFANIYRNFALTLRALKEGTEPRPEWLDFPGVEDGIRGMNFIERVIQSGKGSEKWLTL